MDSMIMGLGLAAFVAFIAGRKLRYGFWPNIGIATVVGMVIGILGVLVLAHTFGERLLAPEAWLGIFLKNAIGPTAISALFGTRKPT